MIRKYALAAAGLIAQQLLSVGSSKGRDTGYLTELYSNLNWFNQIRTSVTIACLSFNVIKEYHNISDINRKLTVLDACCIASVPCLPRIAVALFLLPNYISLLIQRWLPLELAKQTWRTSEWNSYMKSSCWECPLMWCDHLQINVTWVGLSQNRNSFMPKISIRKSNEVVPWLVWAGNWMGK